MKNEIVLIRHGESTWNKENRFTGWADVDLSEKGRQEAIEAAQLLKSEGFNFDCAYSSMLKRAIRTLWMIQDQMDLLWLPVVRSWRLNERHYGALQGLNKSEMAAQYGEDQILKWRRGYDVLPPLLEMTDPRSPAQDRRYADLNEKEIPLGESLQTTVARVLPFWGQTIFPEFKQGKRILVAAHGNSIRALLKSLENISESEIVGLNIPTGVPMVLEFDQQFKFIGRRYLGDPEAIAQKMHAVVNQGKK